MKPLGGNSGISNEPHPFWQQFADLRQRFIRTLWFFLCVTAPFIYFAPEWYSAWAHTILHAPHAPMLITTEVASPFTAPLKLACFTGLFVTLPFFLYQIWRFISEGLYAQEREFFKPLLWMSVTLFYVGAAIAYYIVCPMTLSFFTKVAPTGITLMLDIHHYFDFVTSMMLAFGGAFQLPILLYLCLYFQWIAPEQLRKSRRYVILGAFVLAMFLTPPDVISQVLLAIPLCLLFEISLWIGEKASHRRKRPSPESAHR